MVSPDTRPDPGADEELDARQEAAREAARRTAHERWVALAEVARPHGVRGELRLRLFNTDSDALLDRDEVLVRLPDGEEHEVSVDFARRAVDAILMKLHSVDDRDRAEDLRGALVCLRRKDFPPLEEGEFYFCDIEGAEVVGPEGLLGTVQDIRNYPSVDALTIKAADGGPPWEVPLVDAFVERLDVDARTIVLRTLEGLERG